MKKLSQYTTLEVQALLVLADLELALKNGVKLPDEVVVSMSVFRQVEMLTKGSCNYTVKDMVEAIIKTNTN